MGSSCRISTAPSAAKALHRKKRGHILRLPNAARTKNTDAVSIFDDMADKQRAQAFSYYYDHPEELPDRESGASQLVKQKPCRINVKFDEKIFERRIRLRPIPDEQLEQVGPFVLEQVGRASGGAERYQPAYDDFSTRQPLVALV